MPNLRNAKKALRQSEVRRVRNLRAKRGVKTAVKTARTTIATKAAEAEKDIKAAVKLIDRAAQKGLIKKGTAARKKSRLWKNLKAVKAEKKS